MASWVLIHAHAFKHLKNYIILKSNFFQLRSWCHEYATSFIYALSYAGTPAITMDFRHRNQWILSQLGGVVKAVFAVINRGPHSDHVLAGLTNFEPRERHGYSIRNPSKWLVGTFSKMAESCSIYQPPGLCTRALLWCRTGKHPSLVAWIAPVIFPPLYLLSLGCFRSLVCSLEPVLSFFCQHQKANAFASQVHCPTSFFWLKKPCAYDWPCRVSSNGLARKKDCGKPFFPSKYR